VSETLEDTQYELDSFVKSSDLIVVGKLENVKIDSQVGPWGKNPAFSKGIIHVFRVVKGDKEIHEVNLAMPPFLTIGSMEHWIGPIYQNIDQGIWFLNKNPKGVPVHVVERIQSLGNYYFANRQGSYREYREDLISEIQECLQPAIHQILIDIFIIIFLCITAVGIVTIMVKFKQNQT